MFNSLSSKAKLYLVLATTVLLLFMVFKLNVSKTVRMRRQYKELTEQANTMGDAQQRVSRLSGRLTELNKLLGSSVSPSDLRESILESVVSLSPRNRINLWELPKVYTYSEDDMRIYSNKIILQGTFKSLLKYLYLLETQERLSRIRSANFIYTKKRGTKYEDMYLEIYLQNIEIKNN